MRFPHRGSYSVERLLALDDYCKRTSLWRAIAVCTVFALLALSISVLMESISLQNPCDGAPRNFGAWVRLFFLQLICSIGQIVLFNRLVPQLALSAGRIARLGIATSSCYVVMMIAISLGWEYPVPMGLAIGTLPFGLFQTVFFLQAIGLQRLRASANLRQQLGKPLKIIRAQGSMLTLFMVFSACYHRLPSPSRPFLVILLPVIKLLTQYDVARTTKDLEDSQPCIVAFCVEVFNAVYSVTSMVGAGGSILWTTLLIMAFDGLEFALVLRELRLGMARIRQSQLKLALSSPQIDSVRPAAPLLDAIVKLCQQPGVLSGNLNSQTPPIRIYSSLSKRPADQTPVTMKNLLNGPIASKLRSACGGASALSVVALPHQVLPAAESKPSRQAKPLDAIVSDSPLTSSEELTMCAKHELVKSGLELLFECEYHLLVEYVECLVPLIYAIYFAVLCRLPSAAYYPHTRDLAPSQAQAIVLSLLTYAGLEVASFLLMSAAVWRQCGVRPVLLLAFVLENHVLESQGELLIWYISLLQFPLQHFGTCAVVRVCLGSIDSVIGHVTIGMDYTLRFGCQPNG